MAYLVVIRILFD